MKQLQSQETAAAAAAAAATDEQKNSSCSLFEGTAGRGSVNESAVTQKIKATAAASSSADSHYRYQILIQPKSRLGALFPSPHTGKQCYIPVNTDTNNSGKFHQQMLSPPPPPVVHLNASTCSYTSIAVRVRTGQRSAGSHTLSETIRSFPERDKQRCMCVCSGARPDNLQPGGK